MQLAVKAIETGYYGHGRKKPGKVFNIGLDALRIEKDQSGRVLSVALPKWVAPVKSLNQKQLMSMVIKELGKPAPVKSPEPEEVHEEDASEVSGESSNDEEVI